MMVYAVAQALALIPLTPGGLGFVESGMTTLLVLVGVTADQAVVGTLLYRLIAFWLPIPLGALGRVADQPAPVPTALRRASGTAPAGLAAVHLGPGPALDLGAVSLLLQRRVSRDTLRLGVLAVQGLAHLGLHVGEVVVGVVVRSHASTLPSDRSAVEQVVP